jgi:hypothetical protein
MSARILSDREFEALEELASVLPLPARRERPVKAEERNAPQTLYSNIGDLIAYGRYWRDQAQHTAGNGNGGE